jgi:hypothetical protein
VNTPSTPPPKPRLWRPMALWSAVIVVSGFLAGMVLLARERRRGRVAAIERGGMSAVLELAKIGEVELDEYAKWRDAHPEGDRVQAMLTNLPRLTVPGLRIQDASVFLLTGDPYRDHRPIASNNKPRSGTRHNLLPVEPPETATCSYGIFEPANGVTVPAWFFKAPIATSAQTGNEKSPPRGWVCLVITEER